MNKVTSYLQAKALHLLPWRFIELKVYMTLNKLGRGNLTMLEIDADKEACNRKNQYVQNIAVKYVAQK